MKEIMLNSGHSMPQPGLGVFRIEDEGLARETVLTGLATGYRHIDTAAYYKNERAVGQAVRQCGIPREQIFVTTKVWDDMQLKGAIAEAFQESMEKLDIGWLDLYLVHWPMEDRIEKSWTAMEEILADGAVRTIGVSNHRLSDLERIAALGGTIPAVNQVESHPYFPQQQLLDYCNNHGIRLQAWSPLGAKRATLLEEDALIKVGRKHGKSPAQVVLRWDIQRGVTPLPKSSDPGRQKENLDLFDFSLDAEDLEMIATLDTGKRLSVDPADRAVQHLNK